MTVPTSSAHQQPTQRQPIAPEARAAVLDAEVANLARQGWTVSSSTSGTQAVLQRKKRIGWFWNIILSVLTGGIWLIVMIVRVVNRKIETQVSPLTPTAGSLAPPPPLPSLAGLAHPSRNPNREGRNLFSCFSKHPLPEEISRRRAWSREPRQTVSYPGSSSDMQLGGPGSSPPRQALRQRLPRLRSPRARMPRPPRPDFCTR